MFSRLISIGIAAVVVTAGASAQSTTPPKNNQPTPPQTQGPPPLDEVSYTSLLLDIARRKRIAEVPFPYYSAHQVSSTDPASTDPNEPKTWFSSNDTGNYLRTIEHDDRIEHVMLDTDGPGAIVRMWSDNPTGILRIYLDGADQPDVEIPMGDYLFGWWGVPAPIAGFTAGGYNSYMPIPYAKHCMITHDGDPTTYEISYREYDKATNVYTLQSSDVKENARLAGALAAGMDKLTRRPGAEFGKSRVLPANETIQLWESERPGAITEVSFKVETKDEDISRALRTILIQFKFDEKETINIPLGDFFGSAPGNQTFHSWGTTVQKSGWLNFRYPMPFKEIASISLHNLDSVPARVRMSLVIDEDYKWDDRSLYLHAAWKCDNSINTRPIHDWNRVSITGGKGVFVGDVLSVVNAANTWWGNGDEKIYVDGQTQPVQFGIGLDAYYGQGSGISEVNHTPFHLQTLAEGPGSGGTSCYTRWRALDAIPFNESFRFDLGIDHVDDTSLAFASTVFWYGEKSTTSNIEAPTLETIRAIPATHFPEPEFWIDNAVEGENFIINRKSRIFASTKVRTHGELSVSGDSYLLVRPRLASQQIDFRIPTDEPGMYQVTIYLVKSPTSGIVAFALNGVSTELFTDLCSIDDTQPFGVTGPIDLGVVPVRETENDTERFILSVVSPTANERTLPPFFDCGIDAVVIERIRDLDPEYKPLPEEN